MGKRWMIILIVFSMMMFGSMAFAGDSVQGKTTSQNNGNGDMIIASNSQATPRGDHKALDNFQVDQESGEQIFLLAADEKPGEKCSIICKFYRILCCPASPSGPNPYPCADAEEICKCQCGDGEE